MQKINIKKIFDFRYTIFYLKLIFNKKITPCQAPTKVPTC